VFPLYSYSQCFLLLIHCATAILDLSANKLTGLIPTEICSMTYLGESCLSACDNYVPYVLFQVYSILSMSFHFTGMLYLDCNSLSESIPTEVCWPATLCLLCFEYILIFFCYSILQIG
jgi:hypothetical protein